jgi:hypothetical protein
MSYTDPLGAATEATATAKVVPTLPDVGATWIRTLMVPVIDEWMVQWYGYEPPKLIAFENELPPFRWPEFQSESGAFWVVVCVIVSLFVQWNVSPNAPAVTLGSKPAEALTIEMSTVAACACSVITRNRDAASTNAIERRIRSTPLRWSERRTGAGPARTVR